MNALFFLSAVPAQCMFQHQSLMRDVLSSVAQWPCFLLKDKRFKKQRWLAGAVLSALISSLAGGG